MTSYLILHSISFIAAFCGCFCCGGVKGWLPFQEHDKRRLHYEQKMTIKFNNEFVQEEPKREANTREISRTL